MKLEQIPSAILSVLVIVGCLFLIGVAGSMLGSTTEKSLAQINGYEYGVSHTSLITIKEKFNKEYLLSGSVYYITDYQDHIFELPSFSDYISVERGKTYQIDWMYESGYIITNISASNEIENYSVNVSLALLKKATDEGIYEKTK